MVSRPREEDALLVRVRACEEVDFDRVAIGARTLQRTYKRGRFVCSRQAQPTAQLGKIRIATGGATMSA